MTLDFQKVMEKAEEYKPQISAFLRDMIAIPSESCDEKKVVQRIKQEMEAVGFDRVEIDPMGNILGYIGTGKHLIAMDAHIDTVGIGNLENWEHDPYKGYEDYKKPSYTGLTYPTECYFPCWVLDEDHAACKTLVESFKSLFKEDPVVDKWTFSTNGVSIMGRYGIPCIGFGPGAENQAHAPNEITWKKELVKAAAMYAVIPSLYVDKYTRRQNHGV
jgi:acetylornithine deacetylase/succinyl-diaminopimelate desuccinylase-like protein